jgi:hypothetical protein
MNLEIAVAAVRPLLDACAHAGWPLFLAAEERSHRVGDSAVRVRQCIVQDPDGYLVRFSQRLV